MIHENVKEIRRNSSDLGLGVRFKSCVTVQAPAQFGTHKNDPSKYSGFVIIAHSDVSSSRFRSSRCLATKESTISRYARARSRQTYSILDKSTTRRANLRSIWWVDDHLVTTSRIGIRGCLVAFPLPCVERWISNSHSLLRWGLDQTARIMRRSYGNEFIIRHNAKLKPCLPRDNVILKLVDDDIPCWLQSTYSVLQSGLVQLQ